MNKTNKQSDIHTIIYNSKQLWYFIAGCFKLLVTSGERTVKNLSYILMFTSLLMAGGQKFGKISLPLGKVQFKSESSDWKKAKPNQPVFEGTVIRTQAKSRCEIILTGGGKIRLGENSELELNDADVKPMVKNFNANLKKGNIWVSAKAAFGEKKNIAIRTPTAVAAIRGTKFRAKAGADESSVLVYDGKVDVNQAKNYIEERKEKRKGLGQGGPGGKPKFTLGPVTEVKAPTQVSGPYEVTLEEWVTLAEGMQINIRADGKFHMFEFDQSKDAEDEFVKWNQELEAAEK
jgi:hypothetical protein